ncbi:MAG: DUF899 family protein [Armatimonadetes bacterium]|nr:DUF899 family protein [Armatimonadota bacterium]
MQTRTVDEIQEEMSTLREELHKARLAEAGAPVQDWEVETLEGTRHLSDFFGANDDLLLIHNMGAGCNYCTLWADGFSGYLRHITERCGFLVVSPDSPENQKKLAVARDWKFTMAQDATKEMTTALGYYTEKDGWWPGATGLHRNEDGSIVRTGKGVFGPGDEICMIWPLFDLLPGGPKDWEPH